MDYLLKPRADILYPGPRQVSIARADALPYINGFVKATFYPAQHTSINTSQTGLICIRDIGDHKTRRRLWEMAFTAKALKEQNDGIQNLVATLLDRISQYGTIDVSSSCILLAFDVMGRTGFNRSFESVAKGKEHPALKSMHESLPIFGRLRFAPWLLHMLLQIPGAARGLDPFLKVCQDMLQDSRVAYEAMKSEKGKQDPTYLEKPRDIMTALLWAVDVKDPGAPPTEEALILESRTIIHGGTDNTANTMTNVLWFLAANRGVLEELHRRLDANFPGGAETFDYYKMTEATSEWVNAIIYETLRIRPPVASWTPRVTGPEGLLIPESQYGPRMYIPPDVEVSCNPWVIQRDPRWFERPKKFLPERWLKGSTIRCEKSAWSPFFLGK